MIPVTEPNIYFCVFYILLLINISELPLSFMGFEVLFKRHACMLESYVMTMVNAMSNACEAVVCTT